MSKSKGVSSNKPSDFFDDYSPKTYGTGRCYETHPAMPIGEFKIYGGSCAYPVVKDADIYVGFDHSLYKTDKAYPWVEGESFLYPIMDMHAPADPASFMKLIEWLAVQLAANKKIHLGCIGGHGRTGTVLAALVKHMTGNVNAIEYVRKNYCEKAVESASQIKFLNQHFGIASAEPTKGHHAYAKPSFDSVYAKGTTTARTSSNDVASNVSNFPKTGVPSVKLTAQWTKHPMMIWGDNILFDKDEKPVILKAE